MKSIANALLKAQAMMSNATKGSNNPYFKSKYADLNSVREAVIPPLTSCGIVVLQPIVSLEGKNYVKTMLIHAESGESIDGLTEIICKSNSDPQQYGSGITYARRYGLQSLVCIGAEDDDGEGANGRGKTDKQFQQTSSKIMSDKQLQQAIEKITKGDLGILDKCKAAYNLKDYQLHAMDEAVAQYKVNNNL